MIADSIDHDEAERVASTIYGVTLLVAMLVLSGVWRYASRAELLREDASGEDQLQRMGS